MKKIIYTAIAFVGLFLHSCDLDTTPTEYIEKGVAFNTVKNIDNVLNGTWSYLFDTYFTYQNPGWSSVLLASDAMGNDAALQPGKYGYLGHYQYTTMYGAGNTSVRGVWTLAYKTIDNMNNVIAYIDDATGDEDEKIRIKAQAYGLRGYIYLNLATFYAHAYKYNPEFPTVPIYTKPSDVSSEGNEKSTLEKVYARAEEDLLFAYDHLDNYQRNDKHKLDKNVVAGILARLYLQKEEWKEAAEFAAEAQEKVVWMGQSEYLEGFNDRTNNEWIWGHGQSADQDVASYSFHYRDVSSSSSYYYSFMADPHFMDYFDENDIRFQLFEWDTKRFKGGLMYKKFKFHSNLTGDIVLMRKAEMVLIEAEAYAERDLLPEAIKKLNELREARGADTPDLSTFSKEKLIEEILLERRKELFGEGFALSDIKRRQKAVERKSYPETKSKLVINGDTITVQDHTVTRLPNGTDFTPNNPYYIFATPTLESTNNPNL